VKTGNELQQTFEVLGFNGIAVKKIDKERFFIKFANSSDG
jgi:hypothetical protein